MKGLAKNPRAYPLSINKPLIGVLSCPIGARSRPILSNYQELVLQGQKRGITVYVFDPQDVDWDKKQVVGWTLGKDTSRDKWHLYRFPLFDVVYNRIPNRAAERRPAVKECLERLKRENIPFFNPNYLDKWITYNWLVKDRQIIGHLPKTELFSKTGLEQMLKESDSVYLKPRWGSVGRGIVRVDKVKAGFSINRRTAKGYVTHTEKDIAKVIARLKSLHNLKDYMIQKTIDLARYQGRVFDIRTLIQKDTKGEWKVTGTGVRLAAANAHLTHVPNGGQVLPLTTALGDILEANEIRMHVIHDRIIELALAVAACIDRSSNMTFGELSLDIALDTNLSLWLIEANSKPFRFDEPEIRKLSRNRVLDYATFLTRQK